MVIKTNKGFSNSTNNLSGISKIKVSLCMIVKNEQERLANCLKSVAGFADEIIIVDTGSSDRTVSIAKKFGTAVFNIKIYKFEWCDDFAAARNYALSQASGEWILVLDGDEVLERSIIPTLKAVIDSDCLAVSLNRAEIDSGRSPHSFIVRLFRRRPDIYFTGLYHESVDRSLEFANHTDRVVTVDRVAIYHYGYKTTNVENLNRKRELARRLMEKQLIIDPNDAYIHSKLGALYVEIDEVEKGLTLLKTGLDLSLDLSSDLVKSDRVQLPTLFELNYHLGIAYSYLQNWKLAINHYQMALELDVLEAIKLPAYNNLGNLYQAQTNFGEAIACYEKLLEIAPDFATGYFNLGVARKSVYDFTGAIAAYLQALEINPQYAEAYQNLAVALHQTGKTEASNIAFKEAIKYHHLQHRPEIARQLQNYLNENQHSQ